MRKVATFTSFAALGWRPPYVRVVRHAKDCELIAAARAFLASNPTACAVSFDPVSHVSWELRNDEDHVQLNADREGNVWLSVRPAVVRQDLFEVDLTALFAPDPFFFADVILIDVE